jgi:decaprenyl-phosphate phosphoribosyltransferase
MPPLNATDAHELDYGAPALRVIDEAPSRPGSRQVVVRACRPRQWIKNILVVIAPAAAGALTRPAVAGAVFVALIAFCLLSSATYLVNDVRDAERDRRHPRKRFRPVAAGELSPSRALRIAAIMAALGISLAAAVRPGLALVGVGYLALTTSYSFWWRHVVVADIVAIAGGFVLRAVAGGVAADVPLSRSFLGVTSACALFLVAGKRYAELTGARERSLTRVTLGRYSRRQLRWLMLAAAALGCLAYLRWAFTRPQFGPWIELSSLPFVMWLGRYLIMLAAGYGEAPEELILRDPGLLALGAAWAALFVAGIYVAP